MNDSFADKLIPYILAGFVLLLFLMVAPQCSVKVTVERAEPESQELTPGS